MIFKTIQQMSFTILSHYLQKKTRATAKLTLHINYFLSIYNADIQRDKERVRRVKPLLQWPYLNASEFKQV